MRTVRLGFVRCLPVFAASVVALTVASVVGLPAVASATSHRPVRVQGHWDPVDDDPRILGTLTFRDDRGEVRVFGVTDVRAYLGADAGMAVFRHSFLKPALKLRGRRKLVDPFVDGAGGQQVVLFGVYQARYDSIIVTDIESMIDEDRLLDSARYPD